MAPECRALAGVRLGLGVMGRSSPALKLHTSTSRSILHIPADAFIRKPGREP